MRHPAIFVADFECFLEDISTCSQPNNKSFIKQFQKHEPSSFCLKLICDEGIDYLQEAQIYTKLNDSDDVVRYFIDTLEKEVKRFYDKFKFPKKMIYGKKEKKLFDDSRTCHICGWGFFETSDYCQSCKDTVYGRKEWYEFCDECDLPTDPGKIYKVRDHCHFTGKFRAAAHNICNINYKKTQFFPVIFHNLANYDAHLFIKKLGGEIKCIASNEEKYISFSKKIVVGSYYTDKQKVFMKDNSLKEEDVKKTDITREIRFIDSFMFMQSSLASLADNLEKNKN